MIIIQIVLIIGNKHWRFEAEECANKLLNDFDLLVRDQFFPAGFLVVYSKSDCGDRDSRSVSGMAN